MDNLVTRDDVMYLLGYKSANSLRNNGYPPAQLGRYSLENSLRIALKKIEREEQALKQKKVDLIDRYTELIEAIEVERFDKMKNLVLRETENEQQQ